MSDLTPVPSASLKIGDWFTIGGRHTGVNPRAQVIRESKRKQWVIRYEHWTADMEMPMPKSWTVFRAEAPTGKEQP